MKQQKTKLTNASQSKIFILVMIMLVGFIVCLSSVSAWSNNTFNNSLTNERLNFIGNQNITRYLSVPENTYLINAVFNISNSRDGLVAYYKLDEVAGSLILDSVNGRYNGTINNVITNDSGLINKTFSFNDSDSILISGSPMPGNNDARSISLWVFKNAFGTTKEYPLYRSGANGIDMDFSISLINNNTGWERIYIRRSNADVQSNQFNLTDNAWNNIIVSYDGTSSWGVKFYINGVLFGVDTSYGGNVTFYTSEDAQAIGANWHYSSYPTNENILIDEIAIWNRSLLQEEIYIYNNTPQNTFRNATSNINISINNSQIFYYPNNFTHSNNRTSNFASRINSYLNTCTYSAGYCQVPIEFSSETAGILGYSDLQFNNFGFIENNQTYDSSAYETETKSYLINISFDDYNYDYRSATFYYNGSAYTSITSSAYTNGIVLNATLAVPTGIGTKSFYWTIGLSNSTGTFYYNSTEQNQSIALMNMSFCGSPYTIRYLNFTFHNETTAGEVVSATFDVDFIYSLTSSLSVNKTFSYTSATPQTNYTFCFSPQNKTMYASVVADYTNAYSQSRTFTNTSMTLTNSSTLKDLLLLPNSEGVYITMIAQNQYYQKIEAALITITKISSGAFVESKYTDGTGIAAFWLDSGTSYRVDIVKSGYETFSTTLTPTSSGSVTYSLTETGTETLSPGDGVFILISPKNNKLLNNTSYTFNFTISSSTRTFDEYGFTLWNSTSALSSPQTDDDSSGGTLPLSYNTGNQSYIIMKWYYVVDGEYTNGTYKWFVVNTAGTGTSIANFLSNLNNFFGNESTGIFGIKKGNPNGDFTLAIIVFLITLFLAGIMNYKYGITSVTATMFIIFAIILFFDVGAGLLPDVGNIPNAITWIAGIVTIGFFIREVYQ